jgi:hypothetical protein
MRAAEVESWFGDYLETFAACCRGEAQAGRLLAFYAVPMLLTTDDGLVAMTTDDDVLTMVTQQVERLKAEGYDHSEALETEVVELNASSALLRGRFSRLRHDGSEIARLGATYVVVGTAAGLRMCTIALHSE